MKCFYSIVILFTILISSLAFPDINQDLIEAAGNGNVERVRNLLRAGADGLMIH